MRDTPWHRAAPEDRTPAGLLRWSVRLVAVLLLGALLPWSGAAAAADAAVGGLMAAPFLAAVGVGAHYARRREWVHVALVAALLAVLLAGGWLGLR